MSADFSRIRFNPLADYCGVELKQGGVLLDADFNEWVAVLDRRLRAAASDILGRARVSSTTPDAFKVTLAGGQLQLGIGRLYVDGLLAENHGLPAAALAKRPLDALMAEQRFDDAVPLAQQPYLPVPPALPTGGKHLVYLDVWQREVTHLEQPGLVEVAVNVETSSRLQTVWQVRVLADAAGAGASCSTSDADLPGWAAVVAPSIARLSTGTQEITGADDPCELPPTGGYRGLENQAYRVEIHDAGTPGGGAGANATFKWSRDNASIVSRVAAIVSAHELLLPSFGRDDVLRLNDGDWVEISDDAREFSQRAGEMRRISVDEGRRTISFTPDLPAEMLPGGGGTLPDSDWPARTHLRVKRWDQAHQVLRVHANGSTSVYHDLDAGAAGVIPVPGPGTTLLLERGVTVRFSSATGVPGGRFRAGDFWVFAARTADASVEVLTEAAPRGIHHHFARLALWDIASGQLSDCRLHWPPPAGADQHDCSCSACVTPQSHASGKLTVQAAVDQVIAAGGGAVCLAIGQYLLAAPVRVRDGASLTIRGQGVGSLLVAKGTALRIEGGAQITLENFAVVSSGQGGHVIQTDGAVLGLTLERLAVLCAAANDAALQCAALGLGGLLLDVRIRDNFIVAPNGLVAGDTAQVNVAVGNITVPGGYLISALMQIEGNALVCQRSGIDFSGMAMHLLGHRIADNQFLGCSQQGLRLLGLVADGSMQVCGNGLSVSGSGIVAGVDRLWITDNRLDAARAADSTTPTGDGIVLAAGLDSGGPNECQVLSNQLSGFAGAALRASAPVRDLIVKFNIVRGCGMGLLVQDDGASARVAIENNDVADIGLDPAAKGAVAIAVVRADCATIAGNRVQRVGPRLAQGTVCVGISATGVDRLAIRGNQVADIGADASAESFCFAVLVKGPLRHADVAGNQIDRDAIARYGVAGRFTALLINSYTAATAGSDTGTVAAGSTTIVVGQESVYLDNKAGNASDAAAASAALSARPHASVQGNTIGTRGAMPAVIVTVHGDCLFSDNRVEHRSDKQPGVQLAGDVAVVQGNRVHSQGSSLSISTPKGEATVLGNITTGGITLNGGALGAPWAPLNLKR